MAVKVSAFDNLGVEQAVFGERAAATFWEQVLADD
jgi:hypothetical protein